MNTPVFPKGTTCSAYPDGRVYIPIYGSPSLDGPNLKITRSDGTSKVVVVTGNTLYYPTDLNPAKTKHIYVKYALNSGQAEAREVIDGKYGYFQSMWCPVAKKNVTTIQKKALK